jgi:hypothetical protein
LNKNPNKVTKIILKFEEWLIDQQEREDLVGDLANILCMQDSERISSRRPFDEHKKWVDIVIKIPESGLIAIFNEAWQEFLLAKQVATESLE